VQIIAPGDATLLRALAADGVGEFVVVDLGRSRVDWLKLVCGAYKPVERIALIELGRAELAAQIDWPPTS
jgi:hypothetical protein